MVLARELGSPASIMKKYLRRSVLGLVVGLLIVVAALVGRSMWQQRQAEGAHSKLDFLPGVAQHIRDFHRVKMQDGRKVWEVSAQDAQYFDAEQMVVVRAATMELYLRDGRTIGLKGDEAHIRLNGREIAQVDLDGAIQMRLADYTVRTEHASYDHNQQRISAPGAVDISGRALELRGEQMDVDVQSQRFTLRQHVAMRLEPALANEGGRDALL
jgi:LPS export ABC transporter protein LptC